MMNQYITLAAYHNYEVETLYPFHIRNKATQKIVKESIDKNGFIRLSINRISKLKHKIIAEQYLKNPLNGPYVHFINDNKSDLHLSNLLYSTHKKLNSEDLNKYIPLNHNSTYEILITAPYTIRTTVTNEEVKTYTRAGIKYVKLGSKAYQYHKLIAETFLLNPLNKSYIYFADGTPSNITLDNIIYCNREEYKALRHKEHNKEANEVNNKHPNNNDSRIEYNKEANEEVKDSNAKLRDCIPFDFILNDLELDDVFNGFI